MSSPSPTTKPSINTASSLAQRFTIFIPLSRRRTAESSLALAKAKALAGGWTTRHVAGGWVDQEGNTVTEPVDEVVFLVSNDEALAVHKYLHTLAKDLLLAGEQAVLIVLDGTVATTTYTLKG